MTKSVKGVWLMTQGKKRLLTAVVLLAALLAVFLFYRALTGRQNDHMGYLVRGTECETENGTEYGGFCHG